MSLYYLGNSRGPEQTAEMQRLEAAGICLFCPDSMWSRELLWEGASWVVSQNDYPYAGARAHMLATPRRHVESLEELSAGELGEIAGIADWYRRETKSAGFGFAVRSGDPAYTGGTIRHLHAHLVTGDETDMAAPPVRVKVSSRPVAHN